MDFQKWYKQRNSLNNRRDGSWRNVVPHIIGDNKYSRNVADILDNAKNSSTYKIFDFFRKKMK